MTDAVRFVQRRGRNLLFASLAMTALICAMPAQAQTAYRVDISAGPLDAALLRLAKQTGQDVFFTQALVAGRNAPELKGNYTPEHALAFLLASTDLSATRASPHLLVVQRMRTATPAKLVVGGGADDRPFVTTQAPTTTDPRGGARRAADTGSSLPASPPPVSTVSEIEVTGSHIRGASTASPLLVLSRVDLEHSGQTTLADALRVLPENFGGLAAEGNTLTGADGVGRNVTFGTGLNLRGLGNNATLVLINGRRLAGSGSFGDFSDISTIPMAAVARVEVLLDGASAVYGSDAVGGVVNIIMRKDFDGAETRALAGVATRGEPAQAQVSQTFGKRWDGGGVMLSYDYERREALPDAARSFSASADLRPFGGSDFRQSYDIPGNILKVDPATNALVPGYAIPAGQNGVGLLPSALLPGVVNLRNPRFGEDLLPQQTLNAIYLAVDQDVGDRVQLSADLRFGDRRYEAHNPPAVSALSVTRANPYYVAPTGAASETIAYSFQGDLPNPLNVGSAKTFGATFGGDVRLKGDWRGQGYVTFAQEIDETRGANLVNSLYLNEALGTTADNPATSFSTAANGFFNPFTGIPGTNTAAVDAFIGSGMTSSRSRDQVSSISVQADGSLWRLPGGALKLAVGAQARRETFYRTTTTWVSSIAPVVSAPTDVARNVEAVFAEAQIPLVGADNQRTGVRSLDLSVAGRVEHYQTIGSTANPRIGIRWSPVRDVEVRGTYSRSFRAPALREIDDPSSLNPVLLANGAARVRTLELAGGNPELRPETAESWTGGFDARPSRWPGLALSLTGFDIRYHDRIDRPASVNITNALTDPTLTSFVKFISPTTKPADLALINTLLASAPLSTASGVFQPTDYGAVVDARYVNTTTLHVRGLDVTGSDEIDFGGDRITLAANASYLFRYDQELTPTSPVISRLNLANFPVRFRSRLTADWTRGRLTLGGAFNYIGAYHDALGVAIGDQPTVDLQARLAPADHGAFTGVAVLLNVRNLFDRNPPFYNNSAGFAFDPANADPLGRYVSLQLTRAW